MKKLWIRDRRKLRKQELKSFYLSLLPRMRSLARRSGYALGVHGSCTRDFDLIAVPWVKSAVKPLTLAVRMSALLSKYPKGIKEFKAEGFGGKPLGRMAFVIYLGCHASETRHPKPLYVDLSVMKPGV